MSSPIVIHVLRPYANEDEYLAHEHASIESKFMLLIDQPPLPAETAIVFYVQLTNGEKPIRAEAKVIAHVPAQGADPGGLRVRFKRFGNATKAFIDRAVARSSAERTAASEPAAVAEPSSTSLALDSPLAPNAGARSFTPSLVPAGATESAPDLAPSLPGALDLLDPQDASGVYSKSVAPVPAPVNRDALLARLRGRRAG